MGDFRVVSENSEASIKKREVEQRIERRLRELAANMLRVIRGAGDPMDLFHQMQAALEQAIEHQELTGFLPSGQFVQNALTQEDDYLDMLRRVREGVLSQQDFERWQDDGTIDLMMAERQVISGALQMVASELIGQKLQQRRGENEFHDAIRAVENAKKVHREAMAPTKPAPPKHARKPNARKPIS